MRISDWSSDVCSSDLADEVTDQQDQHTHVKQVGAEHHLLAPQELARLRAPAILSGVETQDAADDQHRDGEIGIPAENQLVQEIVHRPASLIASRWAALIFVTAPLGPPMRSEEHTSELQSLMRISYAVFCLKKKKQHII